MFSVVIVSWKNDEQLDQCLDSIKKCSYYKHETIVVLNENGGNGIVALDSQPLQISFKKNVGLSAAANAGAVYAAKQFICLIDDDMEVTYGWDTYLLNAHIKTKSNWVASTMVEKKPSPNNVGVKDWMKGKLPKEWYRTNSNTPLLIPTRFWKEIGGYDEDFPVVGAELGLAKKAYDHGVRDFIQTPHSIVLHKQSQSMNRLKDINVQRDRRNVNFYRKYGMSRQDFVKMIGKGERYDPTF